MDSRILYLLAIVAVIGSAAIADTWRIDGQGEMESLSDEPQSAWILETANIKQLVTMGKADEASVAFADLRAKYPQQTEGNDFAAFEDAEMFLANRKFGKAAKHYQAFMNKYPQSPLFSAAMEREYAIGRAFLSGQKKNAMGFLPLPAYDEGQAMMERIAEKAGDAPISHKSLLEVSRSLENRGKFEESYHNWVEINSRWPNGKVGADSLLGMADSLNNAYRGPYYDASMLTSAKGYYGRFSRKYPTKSSQIGVDAVI